MKARFLFPFGLLLIALAVLAACGAEAKEDEMSAANPVAVQAVTSGTQEETSTREWYGRAQKIYKIVRELDESIVTRKEVNQTFIDRNGDPRTYTGPLKREFLGYEKALQDLIADRVLWAARYGPAREQAIGEDSAAANNLPQSL